ncbi:MAG: hypothetical protein IJQ02_07780 [Oscillospiraceae bacterium]|nr:hypothetical protein [Oscillospiraceae bacterium]
MMAELFLGCAGMLVTLLAFFIGFFTGRALREQPLSSPEPEVDREKQLRFEAEQKALADCMNYSIDVAYGGK